MPSQSFSKYHLFDFALPKQKQATKQKQTPHDAIQATRMKNPSMEKIRWIFAHLPVDSIEGASGRH